MTWNLHKKTLGTGKYADVIVVMLMNKRTADIVTDIFGSYPTERRFLQMLVQEVPHRTQT